MNASGWYRLLLRIYPRAFRERFGADLEELFVDLYGAHAAHMSLSGGIRFWRRMVADTTRQGLAERLRRRSRRLPLQVHRTKGPSIMQRIVEDTGHAVRALRQQGWLSAVVLITLALAIGANSAVFTVVSGVLLRPLPYGEPERVVMLYMVDGTGRDQLLSVPDFEDLRRRLTTITGLSPMGTQTANLTGAGEPDRLRAGFVGADFFTMLRVQPFIGRGFAPGDDAPGARKTAVLEYDVWQTRLGADPGIIGRSLVLNNEPHEVIGVLPRAFEFPLAENDIWLPVSSSPLQDRKRDSRYLMVFGRVANGVSFEQTDAELKQAADTLAQSYPETNAHWSMRFEDVHALSVMFVQHNLRLLMGAVGCVLLIACANVANLLLARASARQREIAVRAALGASRGRIVGQLLIESLLVAAAGGGLGLALSAALTDAMLTLLPTLPRGQLVGPDARVVAFTAAISVATGIAFGLFPALRLSRPDFRSALNAGARGGEGRSAGRFRAALVVAELALSLVLVTGAGLFIQSLFRLMTVELGYDPTNVLTLEYRLPRNKYPKVEQQLEFHQRVIARIESLPGVRAAAISGSVPQSGNGSSVGFWRAEDAQPTRDAMPRAQANVVSGSYFSALGIPLVEGRTCGPEDVQSSTPSVIVNRLLASRQWPAESPVGKRLRSPDIQGEVVVIGMAGNTRPNLLSQPIAPQLYGCLSQLPGIFATVTVKTTGEPLALARSVQQAIWSVDPDQPMWKIRSAESMVRGSVQRERFVMLMMAFAACLALVLAGVGTYSVLSYTVQRRAREVGIRVALGATRGGIMRLVLAQTMVLTLLGIGAGLAGALAMGQFVATQLYQVSPRDPMVFAITAMILGAVALIAAWLPTCRAASVDPMVTLRAD
jgi:putative ABC transport system permease protein